MMNALEIDEPPELFYVMRSICDYDKSWNEQTKIIDLAKNSRGKLFYDTYPLNDNVSRETFEIDILNHFIYRRIGFDTVTGFKIALVTKLREIMPKYNLMFDLMFRDIFTDTETEEFNSRKDNEGGFENRNNGGYQTDTETSDTGRQTDNKNISKSGNFTENTETSTTEDLRNSDTPQNRLQDVRSGEYVSEYNYNQRTGEEEKTNTHSDTETQTDTLNTTKTGAESQTNTHNDTDTNHHVDTDTFTHEKIRKNTAGLLDKLGLLQEYINIMGMIYKDLDCLFLGVFDY